MVFTQSLHGLYKSLKTKWQAVRRVLIYKLLVTELQADGHVLNYKLLITY